MEAYLQDIFPELADEIRKNLFDYLRNRGVNEIDDFKYFNIADLKDCNLINDFQKRKLDGKIKIDYPKKESEEKLNNEIYLRELEKETETLRYEREKDLLDRKERSLKLDVCAEVVKLQLKYKDKICETKYNALCDAQGKKKNLDEEITKTKIEIIEVACEMEKIMNNDPEYVSSHEDDYHRFLNHKATNQSSSLDIFKQTPLLNSLFQACSVIGKWFTKDKRIEYGELQADLHALNKKLEQLESCLTNKKEDELKLTNDFNEAFNNMNICDSVFMITNEGE